MLQLLLVDDERSVVETLAETIPWESCGVGVVHEALSGAQALDILETNPIDIVITDIRMPGMSGIELITIIHSRWPHIKSILLSGYADFAYAKQAIAQQSFDYLLKPVSDEDLIDSVTRVGNQIREKWEEVASFRKALYAFNEHLPLLRSNTLNELLRGKRYTESDLADKMKQLNLPFVAGDQMCMLLIRMEARFTELPGQDWALMEYAICNIVGELMDSDYVVWHARDSHDYIVLVVKPRTTGSSASTPDKDDPKALLARYAAQIQTNVHNYLKGEVSILVGGWGQFPAQAKEIYDHAVTSMRRRMGHGQGLFLTLPEQAETGSINTVWPLYEPPTLLSLLDAGRFEDVEKKIRQIFQGMLQAGDEQDFDLSEQLIEAYHVLAGAFAYIIHKNGKQLSVVLSAEDLKYFRSPAYSTAAQLLDWSIRILSSIRSDAAQEQSDNHSSIVRLVRSFVDLNLAKDVSLPAIADHVHLHPVYLSKIYKVETGEALTEYVYRLRMEKAAFLLRTTAAKVLEIAEAVGYNNTAYFIRVFKKYYEATPQDYRDSSQL
ncbi:two component transcriptional regulator, AraC family [Paenibacillus curdlanolyticus YK9]|uniref:Two component transcriptional regulator, AraC family n=1 Tax=Paenibacillus curdlanolyticus YK9 TaxID=717606 RepID=E0IG67_9BACL|nr:response regulator [Paenibacillus curdlanolyticus]EFM08469.1 two component transcriptional regulator, AraC family [Paenibacillus curdlanolyticus YK9]